jgi:polyribonucleotide nucleotidyltransferase
MPIRKYLKESIKLGDKELTVETGKVAKQADGSVVIQYGDTMVLCVAVGAHAPREGIDFSLTAGVSRVNLRPGGFPATIFAAKGGLTRRKSSPAA